MKLREFLIFLESNTICSMDLWKEIGWKLPSQSLGSVGILKLYESWMLMTMLSSMYIAWPHVGLEGGCSSRTC